MPLVFWAKLFAWENQPSLTPLKNRVLADISSTVELTGPEILCNTFGSVVGTFSGGGDPNKDLYSWKIFGPNNFLLFSRGPGSFPKIDITFSQNGLHTIELAVSKGGISIGKFSKTVEIVGKPIILLENDYLICPGQSLEIEVIDPISSNFPLYEFEWKDEIGEIINTSNTLSVTKEGNFSVQYFLTNSLGERVCQNEIKTEIKTISSFSIEGSSTDLCGNGSISFATNPLIPGEWFIQKKGEIQKESLGKGSSIKINPNDISTGFGEYELSFLLTDDNNPSCSLEEKINFSYIPVPSLVLESYTGASDCLVADGSLTLKAETDFDFIILEGTSISLGPFSKGDLVEIPNLFPGTYNIIGILGSCTRELGSVVPLVNTPPTLEFELSEIIAEECTSNGKNPGSFKVTIKNGPNPDIFYRIFNSKGEKIKEEAFPNSPELTVSLNGGIYFFEVYTLSNNCILPWKQEVEIPDKNQVSFEVPNRINVCQSFSLVPKTNQPLEFNLLKPDLTSEIKKAGEEFILDQAGEYQLIGLLPNQQDSCPTEKKFIVTLVDPVEFEIELMSEDCIIGNKSFIANLFGVNPSGLLFYWRNDSDNVIGTGQTLFLPPTSYGEFSLEVQRADAQACPIPPKKFLVEKPSLTVDLSIESTKLCEFGPRAILDLTTSSPDDITDIEWRRYDNQGTIEDLPQFKNRNQVTLEKAGIYEVSVFNRNSKINKNCELGRKSIQIDLIPEKIEFSIPGDLSICEPYELIPASTSPLNYTLTFPDGKVETKSQGTSFTIDQDGSYTILGFDPNIKGPKCPEEKKFTVKINPPVKFQPVLVTLTCSGVYEYIAQVENYPSTMVDYFWRDPFGNLVSSTSALASSTYGMFTLEVQPKGSLPCLASTSSFELPIPVLSVDTKIIASTLCPDQPNTSLQVDTNLDEVNTIEWWFIDFDNNRNPLVSEVNKTEILVSLEGTYEVVVKNKFDCILGADQVLILRSTDEIRPNLNSTYQVCPKYGIGPNLDPGQFVNYEWYFEEELVSTNQVFKPLETGDYELFVESAEGCIYQTTFSTLEECELKLRLPNAIQPSNPAKQFLVYTNYLVDELEIWIFNKWGGMIFHCKNTNLIDEESTCLWNGYYNGSPLPNGSYSYRINSLNLEKNIKKEQFGSILVVD